MWATTQQEGSQNDSKNFFWQSCRGAARIQAGDAYQTVKNLFAVHNLPATLPKIQIEPFDNIVKSGFPWTFGKIAENEMGVRNTSKQSHRTCVRMDNAGREINAIARDFNSGYGTAEQLRHAVCLLSAVYERLYALRKKGYLHAACLQERQKSPPAYEGLQQKSLRPPTGGPVQPPPSTLPAPPGPSNPAWADITKIGFDEFTRLDPV